VSEWRENSDSHWGLVQNSLDSKPEVMAGATCGRSLPLPAIASGFGLNEDASVAPCSCARVISHPSLWLVYYLIPQTRQHPANAIDAYTG
jgi:hypothetical protein